MNNKSKQPSKLFATLIHSVGSPVVNELPFFLVTACYFCLKSTLHSLPAVFGNPHLDYSLLVAQRCFVGLFFSYAFAAVAHVVSNRIAKNMVYASMFIIMLIDFFLQANTHTGIGADALRLVAETYTSEATEFLQDYLLSSASMKAYAKVAIYLAAFISLTVIKNKWGHNMLQRVAAPVNWLTLATLLTSVGFGECFVVLAQLSTTEQMMSYCEYYNFPDPVSRIIAATKTLYVSGKETQQAINANIAIKPPTPRQSNDSINIVVVLGESFIKWHSPLYGYSLNTTPHMASEAACNNLITFNNAYSPASQTSLAIKNILSCNSVSNDEKWFDHPIFPTLFKQSNWNVYLWDNQRSYGQGSMWTFALNSFLYDKELNPIAFTENNPDCYAHDGELIDSFNFDVSSGGNLVIFHLNGQHHNASERFPHEKRFMRFTCDSINRNEQWLDRSKKTAIAQYDNATLYNDYILSQIYNKFKYSNSIVIYFSDHGEEIYDYRDNRGRKLDGDITPTLCRYIFEVPFFVWYSHGYKTKYPHKVQALLNAQDKTFSTDDLCHILFNLANLPTEHYKPERDIMHNDYKERIPVAYFGEKKHKIVK